MFKRKPLIFFTVVFAIVAVFAASQAMAFSNEACYGLNNDCDDCDDCIDPPHAPAAKSGWSIELIGVTDLGDGKWDWHYEIKNSTGTASGLRHANFMVPYCCTYPKIYFFPDTSDPDNCVFYEPGEGEPAVKFGQYNTQARVLRCPPDASTHYNLKANTNIETISTVLLNTRDGGLTFDIAVPGCQPAPPPPEAPAGALTWTECVNWYGDPLNPQDDVSFEITRRGDREGCIESLKAFVGLSCDDQNPSQPITAEELPAGYVSSGALRPGTCPDESVNVNEGSPFYLYKIVSGGYLFQFCLDLNFAGSPPAPDPKWTDLSYCQ